MWKLALPIVLLLSAVASADDAPPGAPAPTVATNPAPLTDPWSNVSHVNGTVVPVGDRNAYLYTTKQTNLSIDPFGPLFGYYDLAASRAMSTNLALTFAATGWSHDDSTGYQLAATAPIYFRRVFSGPFLEPGIVVHASNDCTDCSMSSTQTWAGPEVLFGWHWTFDSGLNISWAVGAAKQLVTSSSAAAYEGGGNDVAFNGYFRVGYSF
jgi:hypothetical protein